MIETDVMLYCEDIGMLLPYEAKNYKELLSIMEQEGVHKCKCTFRFLLTMYDFEILTIDEVRRRARKEAI